MEQVTLHIKNMVCSRCQKVVRRELESLGLHPLTVELGQVTLQEKEEDIDKNALEKSLAMHGFGLLDDKKAKVIEKIKRTIIETVHHGSSANSNYSTILSQQTQLDYTYLSSLFSSNEGVTIEKYIILQRIERVKELLIYDELSLKEIAYQLGYSSVAHLSNQFKKITGITPSSYKKLQENNRKPLDEI